MSFFAKPKAVIWPRSKSVDVYLDKKEKNTLSFEINLWEECSVSSLEPLLAFLKQSKVSECQVLVPDDIVLTKSFIYDSQISNIEKKEVIGLAESFVHFKIDPEAIEYKLIPGANKTIIQSRIYEKAKIDILKNNLSKIGITQIELVSVAAAISKAISTFYHQEYFLIYPLSESEFTLLLAKEDSAYLTANLKGLTLDIQKIINYSNLYFTSPINKLFIPQNKSLDIFSTTQLEKTPFNESQIAGELGKPSNLPLPVVGLMLTTKSTNAAIINGIDTSSIKKPMENKKNILPIVAVFIFTAALASVIIWFVLNRNSSVDNSGNLENLSTEISETNTPPEETPTETPTPAIVEVDKTIKIQILNATDINGQAATVKAQLTDLGFKNVSVGNGKEKATANEVQLKPSLSTASAYFESKIGTEFPATYTTDLKETSTYDAIFIIGTDLSTGASASSEDGSLTPTKAKTTVTPTATKSASKTTPTATPSIKKTTPTVTPEE